MYIVNLTEFRKLPAGTVFCKYHPCVFGELQMKGETWAHDFMCARLTGSVYFERSSDEISTTLMHAEKTGESFNLEVDGFCRDGYFEDKQLFGIYEEKDLEQLVAVLVTSLLKLAPIS
jgi:hypothetical protein